jgi:uncharacterized protein YyaL (SSP411 family)
MLQLASATGNNNWITEAAKWVKYVVLHFSDEQQRFFYFTSDEQQDIPVRKADIHDGATPSANAVMANNLLLLGMIMEEHEWLERGENMLETISGTVVRYPYSFGYWSLLLQRLLKGNKTAVIAGAKGEETLREFHAFYAPEVIPILAKGNSTEKIPLLKNKESTGETAVFICTVHECLAPQASVEAALAQL